MTNIIIIIQCLYHIIISMILIPSITQSSHAWSWSFVSTASNSISKKKKTTTPSTFMTPLFVQHKDNEGYEYANNRRRQFICQFTCTAAMGLMTTFPKSSNAIDNNNNVNNNNDEKIIFTSGYGKEEYTNSITASRDTNISPKEVYDSIKSSYLFYPMEQLKKNNDNREPRAFDVGAGAGVSTQTLYLMGYKSIEAVDWSSKAWDENVDETLIPKGVHFHPVDDETFLESYRKSNNGNIELFDVIVFNFAVNDSKARSYAKSLLQPDGRLLAPVNVQSDYWLKQAFKVYDSKGDVLWTANDVGAWSVQFQPDVTQDTCQGIWCAPYNGFKKQ